MRKATAKIAISLERTTQPPYFPQLISVYRNLSESIRVNQSQSELIRAYQVRSGFLRLIPIGSDKFRYPLTNIPLAPNHPLPHCNAPTPLPQRIFVCQPTHEPSHVRAPLLTPNHTYASTAAHLRLPTHTRTAPRLRTLYLPPTIPTRPPERTFTQRPAQEPPRLSARSRPFIQRWRCCCTMETERFSHTNKSFLQCNQVVAPMLSEGLYGNIWEKSIGYPRKV